MSKRLRSLLFVAFTTGLASAASLIGGIGLEHAAERLLPLIPLLIALPGLNDLVGDYASIIAAHTGDPAERQRSHSTLLRAILRVVALNISAIIGLSLLVASGRGYVLTPDFLLKFVIFVAAAILIVIFLMFWLNRALDRLLRAHKYNPDDLLIPITTSAADVAMLGLVTLAVLLVF